MEALSKDIEQALASVRIKLNKVQSNGETKSTSTTEKSHSLAQYGLDNFNCPICNNTGMVWWRDPPDDLLAVHAKECSCMKQRVAIRKMNNSGLTEAFRHFSFDNYETPTPEYKTIKRKADDFTKTSARGFLISGRPGSGKTHICTAICSEMIRQGYETRYFLWRKDIAELKSVINEPEYKKRMNLLKNVPVLYLDDFFKGTVTESDANIAFTLINDRYMSPDKKTIISTEREPAEIVSADEATGSRIIEMCKGYLIQSPNDNWRLK